MTLPTIVACGIPSNGWDSGCGMHRVDDSTRVSVGGRGGFEARPGRTKDRRITE